MGVGKEVHLRLPVVTASTARASQTQGNRPMASRQVVNRAAVRWAWPGPAAEPVPLGADGPAPDRQRAARVSWLGRRAVSRCSGQGWRWEAPEDGGLAASWEVRVVVPEVLVLV